MGGVILFNVTVKELEDRGLNVTPAKTIIQLFHLVKEAKGHVESSR